MRRRWTTSVLALCLGLYGSGCLMIIGVREPIELDDKKVVEIDGELYAVDVEHNRIKKLDRHTIHETTTTTTVETKPD